MGNFPLSISSESWTSYSERLGYYFTANDITDETKKKSILLLCSGAATYDILKNLLQPTCLNDKSYDELVKVLSNYFNPKPSTIVINSILVLESLENLENLLQVMWLL